MAELNETTVRLAAQVLTAGAASSRHEYGDAYNAMLEKMLNSRYKLHVRGLGIAFDVPVLELRRQYLLASLSCIDYTPEEREFIEACIAWMSL